MSTPSANKAERPTVTRSTIEVHRRPVNSVIQDNAPDRKAKEYRSDSEEPQINAAEIQLGRKRYPTEIGFAINEKSTMTCSITAGRGWIEWLDEGEPQSSPIQAGDVVRVPKGLKYAWQPAQSSHLALLIVSEPPWTPDQHRVVEE